jgi:hypothetical protein
MAATDILYKHVTPRTPQSVELLMRTLQEDTKGFFRERIKVLHLSMMIDYNPSSEYYLLLQLDYDESGIPVLSELPGGTMTFDIKQLSRTYDSIISICSGLEEILLSSCSRLGVIPQVSTLRRLYVSGRDSLSLLIQELLLKVDSSALGCLEVLAVYRSQYIEELGEKLQTKVIESRGQPLFPNLRAFHFHDGAVTLSTITDLLTVFGATLKTLSLLKLLILRSGTLPRVDGTFMVPSFPNLNMLITDTVTFRCLFINHPFSQVTNGSLLRKAPVLRIFELRVFRFTEDSMVYSFTPVKQVLRDIPNSLQVLRMILYYLIQPHFRTPAIHHWKDADERLKYVICQERPDLEHLSVEIFSKPT